MTGDLDEKGIANLRKVFPAAIAKIEAQERRNTVERIRELIHQRDGTLLKEWRVGDVEAILDEVVA